MLKEYYLLDKEHKDISNVIYDLDNFSIFIAIPPIFVPKGPIYNRRALFRKCLGTEQSQSVELELRAYVYSITLHDFLASHSA